MEQIKGLGDRMDWLAHYPEGQTPLDSVRIPQYTPAPRVRGLLIGDSDMPVVGKRSTIDRLLSSLNIGKDGSEVVRTTTRLKPTTDRFRGRSITNELVKGLDQDEPFTQSMEYDRQLGNWGYPSSFDEMYVNHTQEFKSEELCKSVDVFNAPPEVVTLQEMGGCDISVSYTHLTLPTIYSV